MQTKYEVTNKETGEVSAVDGILFGELFIDLTVGDKVIKFTKEDQMTPLPECVNDEYTVSEVIEESEEVTE